MFISEPLDVLPQGFRRIETRDLCSRVVFEPLHVEGLDAFSFLGTIDSGQPGYE